MARLELYGTARCPYTGEMRDWLEWKRSEFVEYDVEADPVARVRMREVARRTTQRSPAGGRRQGGAGRLAGTQLHRGRGVIMASACSIRVRGVVQGVGFRPFVYRLARANTLGGWVLNGEEGVEIHLEGAEQGLQAFVREMKTQPPAGRQHCGNGSPGGRAAGRARIYHPRKPAPGAADGPDFA